MRSHDSAAGRVLFAPGGTGGVVRARELDDGRWKVDRPLETADVRCVAADDDGLCFAGTQGGGVLRSIDGAGSWTPSGLDRLIVKSVDISRARPGLIVAGTKPPGLFRSTDGGDSWEEITPFRRTRRAWFMQPAEWPPTPYIQSVALSPTDPEVMLVGYEGCAVVRTGDGGRTWSGHVPGAGRDCHDMRFHHSDGSWVYEAHGFGEAVSRDGGVTFSRRGGLERRYGRSVAAHPARPEVWYVGTGRFPPRAYSDDARASVYRCDGDAPHVRLGTLPYPLDQLPYGLLTDSRKPDAVWAVLRGGTIWESEDRGVEWRKIDVSMGSIWPSVALTRVHDSSTGEVREPAG